MVLLLGDLILESLRDGRRQVSFFKDSAFITQVMTCFEEVVKQNPNFSPYTSTLK